MRWYTPACGGGYRLPAAAFGQERTRGLSFMRGFGSGRTAGIGDISESPAEAPEQNRSGCTGGGTS